MKDEHEAFVEGERQETHRGQDKHKRKRLWRQEKNQKLKANLTKRKKTVNRKETLETQQQWQE